MRALIVGADRVRGIREEVEQSRPFGVTRTDCWDGRHVGDVRRVIPADTRLVIVLCDRLNHNLLASVRRQAEDRSLPLVYCRHSRVDVRDKIGRCVAAANPALCS